MSSASHSCQNCEDKSLGVYDSHNYIYCKVILESDFQALYICFFFCFKAMLVIHCSNHVAKFTVLMYFHFLTTL